MHTFSDCRASVEGTVGDELQVMRESGSRTGRRGTTDREVARWMESGGWAVLCAGFARAGVSGIAQSHKSHWSYKACRVAGLAKADPIRSLALTLRARGRGRAEARSAAVASARRPLLASMS
jgi:hypothetical protein